MRRSRARNFEEFETLYLFLGDVLDMLHFGELSPRERDIAVAAWAMLLLVS
jgi:hypothetical protein